MLHKTILSTIASAAMLELTGCGLFQSSYPDHFPADWKAKEPVCNVMQEVAPGVTAYAYYFKNFKDNTPLSVNFVVADWKKTGGKVGFKVVSADGALRPVTTPVKGITMSAVAAGTESDAAGKPLTAVKVVTPSKGSVVIEPADPKKRVNGYALVSASRYFPMIVKSSPGVLTDPDFECVIQGMLLAKDGKSIFSRPVGGNGAYTVIGLNQEKQLLILMVVDGYHPEKAPGVSISDLSEMMIALGAKDVLCINAGPSGVLAISDQNGADARTVISHPSDGGVFDHTGDRPASNWLGFSIFPLTEKSPVRK